MKKKEQRKEAVRLVFNNYEYGCADATLRRRRVTLSPSNACMSPRLHQHQGAGSGCGSGQLGTSALVGGIATNRITTFLVEAEAEAVEAALKS